LPRSRSAEIRLANSAHITSDKATDVARVARDFAVPVATVEHLRQSYGGNFVTVLELARQRDGLKRALIDGLPHIEAEVIYAARYEMAASVDDVLSRRTRIRLLTRDGGAACAARVAQLMTEATGVS
jgi:glycerol-3-phosphate dehydrogenase